MHSLDPLAPFGGIGHTQCTCCCHAQQRAWAGQQQAALENLAAAQFSTAPAFPGLPRTPSPPKKRWRFFSSNKKEKSMKICSTTTVRLSLPKELHDVLVSRAVALASGQDLPEPTPSQKEEAEIRILRNGVEVEADEIEVKW